MDYEKEIILKKAFLGFDLKFEINRDGCCIYSSKYNFNFLSTYMISGGIYYYSLPNIEGYKNLVLIKCGELIKSMIKHICANELDELAKIMLIRKYGDYFEIKISKEIYNKFEKELTKSLNTKKDLI